MRTIQYTQLLWGLMLTAAFGLLLLAPNTHRIFAFCIVLIYTAIAICAFKNYKWAWIICIISAICVFVFRGLSIFIKMLPTNENLTAHNEFPMGSVILAMESLLFLAPPSILLCYYFIYRKKLLGLLINGKP